MPALPEVETIVRQLGSQLPESRIRRIRVHRKDLLRESVASFRRGLEGSEIRSFKRRGKNIIVHHSGGGVLLVNLGMTGQLLYRGPAHGGEPPSHLGLTFELAPEGTLFYADVRRFGHLLRLSDDAWAAESRRLGPEPLGRGLTPLKLHGALQASRSPIRSWLLDQTRIAGIGNIYAAEALFRAGIHPGRPAGSLTAEESRTLLAGIREVLREAIRARGTTLRDYRTASGDLGSFGPRLQVYGRAGEACPVCKCPVERIVFGNRSAYFCPRCQPEPS